MSQVRERFEAELAEVEWADLRAHEKRGSLIVVDDGLDLVEVAVKVAEDDAQAVSGWINTGKLSRPGPEQVASWVERDDIRFRTLIVQPYVLTQPVVLM